MELTPPTASLDITELKEILIVTASKYNLAYDLSQEPVKVSPDCYMFYATPLDAMCRKKGLCVVNPYYALTGGECVTIMDKNNKIL